MNRQPYRNLSNQHFVQQLWRNDLEMAEQELTFFEQILEKINPIGLAGSPVTAPLTELIHQMHTDVFRIGDPIKKRKTHWSSAFLFLL